MRILHENSEIFQELKNKISNYVGGGKSYDFTNWYNFSIVFPESRPLRTGALQLIIVIQKHQPMQTKSNIFELI